MDEPEEESQEEREASCFNVGKLQFTPICELCGGYHIGPLEPDDDYNSQP